MDNLSHAFIGVALAALSGHPPSLTDPLYIATILGAQAPDFDIITHLKSNFSYMKSHRAFSHSLPGLIMWSSLITVLLLYNLGMTDWLSYLLWSFIGGLSHILLDYFNTHGASLLWPFNKKRQTNHLLNVFDPLLLLFFSIPYFFALPAGLLGIISLSTLACYLALRTAMRVRIKKRLTIFFAAEQIARLAVMPNLKRVLVWDFVVELADAYIVGQFNFIQCKLTVKTKLLKQQHPEIAKLVQTTELGEFFQSFTPYLYLNVEKQANGLFLVRLYDLRYFLNEKFVHRAIIHFDKNKTPLESYLLTANHIIKIPT
jgi:inner membrane protein